MLRFLHKIWVDLKILFLSLGIVAFLNFKLFIYVLISIILLYQLKPSLRLVLMSLFVYGYILNDLHANKVTIKILRALSNCLL